MIVLDQLRGPTLTWGWPQAEPWLTAALERSPELTAEMVLEQALERRMAVWAIYDSEAPLPFLGAAATGVRSEDGVTVAEIHALGGKSMHLWLDDVLAEFENLAFEHGVNRVQFWGRKGWERQLPDYLVTDHEADGRICMIKEITVA